jgi:hypothetical protein
MITALTLLPVVWSWVGGAAMSLVRAVRIVFYIRLLDGCCPVWFIQEADR